MSDLESWVYTINNRILSIAKYKFRSRCSRILIYIQQNRYSSAGTWRYAVIDYNSLSWSEPRRPDEGVNVPNGGGYKGLSPCPPYLSMQTALLVCITHYYRLTLLPAALLFSRNAKIVCCNSITKITQNYPNIHPKNLIALGAWANTLHGCSIPGFINATET